MMKAFVYAGVAFEFMSIVFAIVGVSTLEWFVVTHDVAGFDRYSRYSITGRIQTDSTVQSTSIKTSLTYDVWSGTASCSGSCDTTALSAKSCNDLKDLIGGNLQNQWYYDSLCPYGQTTLAFVVFGLLMTLLALLTSGMAMAELIPPLAGGVCNLIAFFSYLIAAAVYGGGVGVRARGGWFGVNAITQMGYSYILVCIAMFLSIFAGVVCIAATTPGKSETALRPMEFHSPAPRTTATVQKSPSVYRDAPPPVTYSYEPELRPSTRAAVSYTYTAPPPIVISSSARPGYEPRYVTAGNPKVILADPDEHQPQYITGSRVRISPSTSPRRIITATPPQEYIGNSSGNHREYIGNSYDVPYATVRAQGYYDDVVTNNYHASVEPHSYRSPSIRDF